MLTVVSILSLPFLQASTCSEDAEAGQGLVEYGLILALVAVLCIAALTTLQGGISSTLNSVTSSL